MYYLSDICSLCLMPHQNIENIFSQDTDGTVIVDKLKLFLLEFIYLKSNIPKHICSDCLSNLNFIYKIRLTWLENTLTLKKYVDKLEKHGLYTNLSVILNNTEYEENYSSEQNSNETNLNENHYVHKNCAQDEVNMKSDYVDCEHTDLIKNENEIDLSTDIKLQIEDTDQSSLADVKQEVETVVVIFQKSCEIFEELNDEKDIKESVNTSELLFETSEHNVKPCVSANVEEEDCVNEPEPFADNDSKAEYLPLNASSSATSEKDIKENVNTSELLFETLEHNVKPRVSANVEEEDCVNEPEPFEDNDSKAESLPLNASSFATSEAADCDLDAAETQAPVSCKIIKSEGTNSNVTELLFETSEHIVKPCVSANLEEEDYVSEPEPFEDNGSDDEYLPSNASSSATSEAADSDLDVAETQAPVSCKIIKSEGTKSNVTENATEFLSRSGGIEEKESKCNKVGVKEFKQSNPATEHTRAGEKKCDVCSKVFTTKSQLTVHKRLHTGEKPFVCEVCGKAFITTSDLKKHKRVHTGEKPFECEICGKAFNRLSTLKIHIRMHTGEKPYKCDVCDKAINTLSHLKKHKRVHTGEKPFECEICGRAFTHMCNLKSHKRLHTGEKPYKCDVCDKGFNQLSNLKSHKRVHTGEKLFVCEVCGKAFIISSDLKKHKRVHTGEKPFECEICGKAFNQLSTLKIHIRMHTGEKPYKCDVCDKAINTLSQLKKHKRVHTGEKPFECEICGKTFTQMCDLKSHKRLHTGEKPYKCDVCDKRFNQLGHLKLHKRVHTGEKPFECETCGKAFTRMCDLKSHKRVHTGEKPFVCEVCGKAFIISSDLKKHKRVHTGEKPFECEICGKAFNRLSTLKIHIRMHTGEKPYKCDVCGKAFITTSDLKKHKRVHIGEKPFECEICGKAFTQMCSLKSHKQIHTVEKLYKCSVCNKEFTHKSNLNSHERIQTGGKPSEPEPFVDNVLDDEHADNDLDAAPPVSCKIIKSDGTNSNVTENATGSKCEIDCGKPCKPEPFEDNDSDDEHADSDLDAASALSCKIIKSDGTNSNVSENATEFFFETHIVKPYVSENLEEDYVSEPKPFEDNGSQDEYLPPNASSSAKSEVIWTPRDTGSSKL